VSALVFVEATPLAGREVPAVDGTTVGREGCDVLLPDPEVSRRHAIVRVTDDGPAIEDLGSTNGTWVNDLRISGARPLRAGDVVRFGNTIWHVREAPDGRAQHTTVAGLAATPSAEA
jgi:pSer/pThr/pTyr-binding forkhead associated (FHA) protein